MVGVGALLRLLFQRSQHRTDEPAAYVYADFIDGFVIDPLHMEAVVDHVGVVKYLGGYQHHRRRQVAGHFFNPAPYRLIHGIDEYGYDFVALCSGDGGRQRATAAMTVFVGKERPHFAVAQAGLVKAHVRSDVGCVEIEAVPPVTYSNGETMRQILARSKHTLMMSQNKWTDIQRHRVNILFKHHPILKSAYNLAMELRHIFNAKISPTKAMGRMNEWYEKVMALGNNNFRSVIKTFRNHAPTILNYFRRRATNASAESFNSKVKIFRSQMRGVRDRDFFIFRLVKLYA